MSFIIAINSTEQNVGVTTTSLTLAEKINYFTKKNVCILELCSSPSISYILENNDKPSTVIDNILPFINESSILNEEITKLIELNTVKLNIKTLGALYGSRQYLSIPDYKIDIILQGLKTIYDVIIIDMGQKKFEGLIYDNTDLNIFIVQSSSRFISSLIYKREINTNKTKFLFNNGPIGTTKYITELKSKLPNVNLLGALPNSDMLTRRFANNTINVESGEYMKKISKIALKICKENDLEIKLKMNTVNKLLGKAYSRDEEVMLEERKKGQRLGDILIDMNICTRDDIDRALRRQSNREMLCEVKKDA